MTKTVSAGLRHRIAQRELFVAREALTHLLELYNNGKWRLYYKTDMAFARVGSREKAGFRSLE
jgi:hypothetical protein